MRVDSKLPRLSALSHCRAFPPWLGSFPHRLHWTTPTPCYPTDACRGWRGLGTRQLCDVVWALARSRHWSPHLGELAR